MVTAGPLPHTKGTDLHHAAQTLNAAAAGAPRGRGCGQRQASCNQQPALAAKVCLLGPTQETRAVTRADLLCPVDASADSSQRVAAESLCPTGNKATATPKSVLRNVQVTEERAGDRKVVTRAGRDAPCKLQPWSSEPQQISRTNCGKMSFEAHVLCNHWF